jgi:hypothetical protein
MSYADFLIFSYKLGLVNKNYDNIDEKQFKHNLINKLEIINKSDKKNKEKNFNIVGIKPYFYENDLKLSFLEERNIKNKLDVSTKIVQKNGLKSNRSVEKKLLTMNTIDNYYENIFEYKLIKEAWTIITKSNKFNQELLAKSKRVFIFFLSLCGIYKGNNIKDSFIKKKFPFLSKQQSILTDIDSNYVKYIYKYFDVFRKSIINNVIEKTKPKKKESDIRTINFTKNIERNSKSFINKIFNANSNKVKIKHVIKAYNKKVKKHSGLNVKISLKKVNGKYLKYKKIKVKFRGKIYKIKTNKKGVAIWKIKKSMVKNLKVGKSYTYKITYGKDVLNKKITIKR